jgi:hypothetical protein
MVALGGFFPSLFFLLGCLLHNFPHFFWPRHCESPKSCIIFGKWHVLLVNSNPLHFGHRKWSWMRCTGSVVGDICYLWTRFPLPVPLGDSFTLVGLPLMTFGSSAICMHNMSIMRGSGRMSCSYALPRRRRNIPSLCRVDLLMVTFSAT